ncbi:hypothetical protein EPO15_15750 [bacterium]|nr:MAG: hypothetical protein EPO15_15750 [bacterium]
MAEADAPELERARRLISEAARLDYVWENVSRLREALRPLRGAARRALEEASAPGAPEAERKLSALLLHDLFPPWPKE